MLSRYHRLHPHTHTLTHFSPLSPYFRPAPPLSPQILSPRGLPKVFKNSIDADLLFDILSAIPRDAERAKSNPSSPSTVSFDPAFLLELLAGLARVPRFDMTVMFWSSGEYTVVKPLLAQLGADAALVLKYCGN